MAKTFLPTLVDIVHRLCVYTTRYDAQIRRYLEPEAIPAYNALVVACSAFLAVLELVEPPA